MAAFYLSRISLLVHSHAPQCAASLFPSPPHICISTSVWRQWNITDERQRVCVFVRASGQQGIGWPSLSAKLIDAIEPPPGSITWQRARCVLLCMCASDLVWLWSDVKGALARVSYRNRTKKLPAAPMSWRSGNSLIWEHSRFPLAVCKGVLTGRTASTSTVSNLRGKKMYKKIAWPVFSLLIFKVCQTKS